MDLIAYRQLMQERVNHVRNGYLFKYEEDCDFKVANEIIAYLIAIYFLYSDENGSGYNNLTNYYNKRAFEGEFEFEDKNDEYTNGFRKLQRREQKIRGILNNYQNNLKQKGFDISNIHYMRNEQMGRFYDLSDLEFIYQRCITNKPFDLYDMVISGRICDSNKVSSKTLADGYDTLNLQYEEAKNTKDMMNYIVKWIDFFRMEMAMRYSLIYKIGDYISKNGDVKDFALLRMTDVWGTRYFDDGYISPPFQILRQEKFIKPYFSAQTEEELLQIVESAEKERILESVLVRGVLDEAKEFFINFRKKDKLAIKKIYLFCKYQYPIIESFTSINLNLDGSNIAVDKRKIKCLRKIYKYLIKPEELKKLLSKPNE